MKPIRLDIDALKIVADGVNQVHTEKKATLVITHYQRWLDYMCDKLHVLYNGRIVIGWQRAGA